MDQLNILITGATLGGIGYETALGLAAMGHNLILTSRSEDRADKAAELITEKLNCNCPETYALDLSEEESIKKFTTELINSGIKLDVLINNAGYLNMTRRVNSINQEMSMAVNYLGTRLLTTLLLPLMNRGGRIINVSSSMSSHGYINHEDFFMDENWKGFQAYYNSKLALNLYTRELANELIGREITVNALHPGNIITNIWNLWPENKILSFLIGLIEKTKLLSVEKGAETSIYLAISPDVKDSTDGFYRKNRKVNWPANCRDFESKPFNF